MSLWGDITGRTAAHFDRAEASFAASARAVEQQRAKEINRLRRIEAIRGARTRIAAIRQSAVNLGVAGGTGEAGAVAGTTSRAAASISFLNLGESLSLERNRYLAQAVHSSGAARESRTRAATYAAIADFGSSLFSGAGGFESLFGSFNAPTKFSTSGGLNPGGHFDASGHAGLGR